MDCETFANKNLPKNRWRRIEQKHKNNIHNICRNPQSNSFCKNVLNSNFVNEKQIKRMSSNNTWYLDPNLVMDLRHESIERVNRKSTIKPKLSNGIRRNPIDEFQEAKIIEQEIEEFRHEIETQRREFEMFAEEVKKKSIMNESTVKFQLNNVTTESDELIDTTDRCSCGQSPSDVSSLVNGVLDDLSDSDAYDSGEDFEPQMKISVIQKVIQSEDAELVMEEETRIEETKLEVNQIKKDFHKIIPSLQLEVEETISVRNEETECNEIISKERISPKKSFNGTLTLDHQFSIHIKQLTLPHSFNEQNENNVESLRESSNAIEKSTIIENLFDERLKILRKYFMKWTHYTTIQKLTKNNVDQSRVKKMELFLRNIAIERKKALRKMKEISKSGVSPEKIVAKMRKENEINEQTPEIIAKKYNNKLKIQQDIIELQKLKLKRQERIIAELKLSRILEDTDESKNDIKDELKFFARTGCQQSRSKARCLQVAGNLKDEADDELYEKIQAKGLCAPKFLIEMQARALEREIKHRQARERREAIEKDREEMRMVAEETKRREDQNEKRKRIEELRRKRIEEKNRKIQKEMDRLKYVADMEKAKYFYRYRVQKFVFAKFRNLIRIKKRNEKLAIEFRNRMRFSKCFVKWKTYVDFVWTEKKQRAENHHKIHCLRFTFTLWQKYYLAEISKRLVAEDWYDLQVTERWFQTWHLYTNQCRLVNEMKKRKAEIHWEWHLKWKVIDHWRRLRIILKIEKETEMRREHWRKKVHELLPDYVPNRDDY